MAQLHLNVGTTANDGTGDSLRVSQQKAESNFNELYARPDFTDAPSDGNLYGRKDATWEQITGGSGTTPTLQEVVVQGNEIINTAGNLKLVLDKEDNGIFLYELVSSVWENRGYYNSQGFTLGGFDGTPTFDLNIYTGTLTIYQGTDIIQFSPNSATKNGVEFATEDFALSRNGSNANSDVDIASIGYSIITKFLKVGSPTTQMEVRSENLSTNRTAQWQDKEYTAIADMSDITDALATFKITEFLDATSSIQGQLNSKQNALSYTPFKFIQASQTAHTGTTAETILATATIPANTFSSNEILKALFGINKTGTGGAYTIRIRINTSNTLSGATTIATFTAGSGSAQLTLLSRNFTLLSGNLYGYTFTGTAVSDVVNVGGTLSSTTYNTANALYVFWTVQLVNSADSITPNLANLTN